MCKLCTYVSGVKVYVRNDDLNRLANLDRSRLVRYLPEADKDKDLLQRAYSAFAQYVPQGVADVTAFTLTVQANGRPI